MLVALLIGVFVASGFRPGRAWVLFAVGLTLNSAADVIYAWQTAAGTYVEGTPLEALVGRSGTHRRARALAIRVGTAAAAACRAGARSPPRSASARSSSRCSASTSCATSARSPRVSRWPRSTAVLIRTALTFRENISLAESRRLAAKDDLTGLANRRGFYALADAALARIHEQRLPTALLLLDLDRFKELNDTLGHQAGDELLTRFAERLTHTVPEAEVIGRLGGDEFVLLMPAGTGAAEALEIADRVNADARGAGRARRAASPTSA